jgi:hypothetical protein
MRPTRRIDANELRLAASKHLGPEGIKRLRAEKLGYDLMMLAQRTAKSPAELCVDECADLVEVSRRVWQRWSNPHSGKWMQAGPVRLFCLETGLNFDEWDPLAD